MKWSKESCWASGPSFHQRLFVLLMLLLSPFSRCCLWKREWKNFPGRWEWKKLSSHPLEWETEKEWDDEDADGEETKGERGWRRGLNQETWRDFFPIFFVWMMSFFLVHKASKQSSSLCHFERWIFVIRLFTLSPKIYGRMDRSIPAQW